MKMLEIWLEQIHVYPPASWATIIEAVEFLGEEQLGREPRHKTHYNLITSSLTIQILSFTCS